jgi:DNA-binding NtrC family response regulator
MKGEKRTKDTTMAILEKTDQGNTLELPDGARILIVCDSDAETERLKRTFPREKFILECVRSMAEGCEAAKSGRFQVIFSTPVVRDGSWTKLTDIASHYDLPFEIVLWVSNFDLPEWAKALNDGAFDVLDAIHEQRRVAEVTKRAVWAAFLKGAGPSPRAINSRRVA